MECVQLALPQRVCNELGLHLNQTVTLSNSKNFCAVYVHEDEANTSNNFEDSSQHPEPTLPEIYNETDDEESGFSRDDSFLALANAGNSKQKIFTYNLKSTTLVSNERSSDTDTNEHDSISNSSHVVDISATELQTGSYNIPVPETSEIIETVTRVRTSFESHVFQETSTSDGWKREKIAYPRYCTKCSRRYSSQSSFSVHKRRCGGIVKVPKDTYPRLCLVCNHSYSSRSTYSFHKKRCGRNRYEHIRPKITYPRPCPICNKNCSCKSSFSKHKIACTKKYSSSIAMMSSAERACKSDCTPNDSGGVDEGAINNEKQSGTWIPVTNDSKRMLRYFVVKKT